MAPPLLKPILAAAALAFAGPVAPALAAPDSTQSQTDSVEALITDYEAFLRATDPVAEARGTGAGPTRWPDVTPQAVAQNAAAAETFMTRLSALDHDRMVDAAILDHILSRTVIQHKHDTARIPFTGDSGFHSAATFAASRANLLTLARADAYVARLEDLPRYFEDNIANLQRGIETGWTAHGDPLSTMMEQVNEQIVADPVESELYAPLTRLPTGIPDTDRIRLKREGREAVADAITAYQDLLTFLEDDYARSSRLEPGLAGLRGGRVVYADLADMHTAGAGLTPEQIHKIGQEEVARIRGEMLAILDELAFEGSLQAFLTFLRTDDRFYARTSDDLIEKAAEISKRLDAVVPQYFGRLPRLPYGVSPVPASIAPGFTTGRYAQGDPETGRSGTYLVNTYRLDQRPLYELPALTAHEAVPGHHLQIALAQEMRGVPEYRRRYYATAFGEGWALYAEKIAGEAGIYRTPYERFGQLSYEMWRACRLVADTGLHWYGWSREQAEACFIENTALAPLNIETEVTRYIGWPGQALAYKIGELEILKLREEARTVLGPRFDIRDFHDHLLAEGSTPLSTLSARMRQWIEDQKAAFAEMEATPAP
ncbi:MAG: DUF885 domain-containing protein [Pseudomonadota bacterium]